MDVAVDGAATLPAPGHMSHCRRYPRQCQITGKGKIKLTGKVLAQLKSINRSVNNRIVPREDTRNRWTINPAAGDCEDYAATKRFRLLALGYPSSALLLALVMADGEPHLVLVIRTDKGNFVLDNLNNSVPRQHYHIVKIQSADNPRHWRR